MSASYSYNQNYRNSNYRPQRKNFVEDRDAAFFLGKLNKHHDREHIYNQLKRLTKNLNFYIAKFDMPNGPNGRGNQGFAFVHTKSKEQARRIIAMKHLRLGTQECEVKSYDGRTDVDSNDISGRGTPDSGVKIVSNSDYKSYNNRPKFVYNPLSTDTRSRVNSGIKSESSRFSETGKFCVSSRNLSESESHEEQKFLSKKINPELNQSDLKQSQINIIDMQNEKTQDEVVAQPQINYESNPVISTISATSTIPAKSTISTKSENTTNSNSTRFYSTPTSQIQNIPSIAESELHDHWLEEQTSYILNTINDSNMVGFMIKCDEYMKMLVDLQHYDASSIAEVTALQNGRSIYQTVQV
jgi:hypothetical protein